MNTSPARVLTAILGALALQFVVQMSRAASLTIANPSFETPAFGDGEYDYLISPGGQGTHGWQISDGAFVYNPTALDYATAGGNGTPPGASGAQISGVFQFGDYTIFQRLAGGDGIVGNDDDPLLMPHTLYALTVAVGQRLGGNQFGVTYGGYDIQLVAAGSSAITILGRETDVITPAAGMFVDRTIFVNSASVDANLYGQPLAILLRKTIVSQTANTDFDNARLAAVTSPGDYNDDGRIDAADYTTWRDNLGAAIAMPNEGSTPGMVTTEDYDVWKANFGSPGGAGSSSSVEPSALTNGAVPEPANAVLVVSALASLAARRPKRRSVLNRGNAA